MQSGNVTTRTPPRAGERGCPSSPPSHDPKSTVSTAWWSPVHLPLWRDWDLDWDPRVCGGEVEGKERERRKEASFSYNLTGWSKVIPQLGNHC